MQKLKTMLMNNFLLNRGTKSKLSARISLGLGLLLLLLLQSAASFAQKITLNYQNTSLEQVLREIRKQSGYDIFFDQNLVNQQPAVAVKITNANVEEAMSIALKGLPLSFTVNGKAISIKRPEKAVTTAVRQQKITITGTIIDDNGSPMAGVSVSSAGVKPVYTDGLGKFTLKDIDPLAVVNISYTGKLPIERTALAISLMSEIQMETGSINLNETIIQGQRVGGKVLGGFKLDITHRKQLSLSQALEGTIPGLVIRNNRTTTSRQLYVSDGTMVPVGNYTLEELKAALRRKYAGTFMEGLVDLIAETQMESGSRDGSVITETTTTSSITPELRGAGGFGTGANAMLVIIDGFVQNEFPADYPMNNVLSVEVIRDPAETIKWGPGASNGVIIITTNGGKPGELQITYNSTFNFSGAPDNSNKALQRANTSQLLDYYLNEEKYKETADGSNRPSEDLNIIRIVPARLLLEKRFKKKISETEFQNSWELLSQLSNEEQYREQQQGIFSQNQNLNLTGGGKYHRFSINGNYNTSHTEALGNKTRIWGMNFRDQLSLLNNKLQIALQVNGNLKRNNAGNALDPAELEPYQMLYRADGSYVYDYSAKSISSADNNTRLKNLYPALQDYGYNPLEEARGTQRLSKSHLLNSSLNINWKLLDGLTWSTNLQYVNSLTNGENFISKNTNYARSLYNNYYAVAVPKELFFPGSGIFVSSPIDPKIAFVPWGDVFRTSQSRSNSTNLRTGFGYNRLFDKKHALNLRVGFSYYDALQRDNSNLPLYGYNSSTGLGTALSLPAPDLTYEGVMGGPISFNPLTTLIPMNKVLDRNMSANAHLDYTYDERLGLQAFYNQSFMPVMSANIYSSTRNYNALASWALHKESFFKLPLISKLKLSAGFGEIKMASLPVQLPATRTFDPLWDFSYLEVNGYNAIRQNGEQIRNYDALLDLGLFKDVLQGQFNYRYNSMGVKNQLSGRLSYHISKAGYFNLPWMSNLMVEGWVTNISPAQALAQMMTTNTPADGGGFSIATGNAYLGLLPQHIINREISLRFGLWKDRLTVDSRYYNRSTSGLTNGFLQADLSTGFAQRAVYSRLDNKGYEFYIQGKILQGDGFNWTSTINAAYNTNQVKDAITPLYNNNTSYLRANRNGYAVGSLWSLRWAGLDANGNPQVFDPNGNKITAVHVVGDKNPLRSANENWVEYSGRTIAPWSGAFIEEFAYKGLYARATVRFALGHVMRVYRPNTLLYSDEKSSLIDQRWRQPGDEAKTDIPRIADSPFDFLRTFATQNSSNSIAPADFLRLSEIQVGYDVPAKWLTGRYVKSLNLAFNLQNVALWTRNKLGIDPEAISPSGKILVRQPMRYGLTLMVGL